MMDARYSMLDSRKMESEEVLIELREEIAKMVC